MPAELRYKAFLVDKQVLQEDPHFSEGCPSCHGGNEKAANREGAHKGLVKRVGDLKACSTCHEDVVKTYGKSLHYTAAGLRHGVSGRFSKKELAVFDEKVFQRSCRSCHATCSDCHVKSPAVGGVSTGLLKGHRFVKRDDGKTCALCHGGRVYPEFTGDYGGSADIHYQKGMTCLDCHKKAQFHGTGVAYTSKNNVKERPSCANCHKPGSEKTEKAKAAHGQHDKKVSCYACHSGGQYRNCYDCHLGKGATSRPGFYLGLSPRDGNTVTTLRLIPTVRSTFKDAGIAMETFDAVPNYWDAAVHNIKKRTDRTRSCEVCHDEKEGFLTKGILIKNGAKANEKLLYVPKSIK